MSEQAWRGVVEYQVLKNGVWEDRRYVSKIYQQGSAGPMTQVNRKIAELESGRYFEGSWHTKDLVKFDRNQVIVLTKYKEESDTWKQI